jgi:hypothetical protein
MDDPNKLNHVFGNPDHHLDVLVRRYGSQEAAFRGIVEAVNHTHHAGTLVVDTLGRYNQIFEVGGNALTVRGRIVNGVIRVGSAWFRASATGNDDA